MSQTVMLKSNKYGINLILDDEIEFDGLIHEVIRKFREADSFFKGAKMALSFEGRRLSPDEEILMVEAIEDNSSVQIICVVDTSKEQMFRGMVERKEEEDVGKIGQFYRGTLRGGQQLESEMSLIIMGDVHEGAKVISKGNIVVLGALRGTAYAGAQGNTQSFVLALDMDPVQIKIGDVIGRSADKVGREKKKKKPQQQGGQGDAHVAIVKNDNIYIEPISKGLINNI